MQKLINILSLFDVVSCLPVRRRSTYALSQANIRAKAANSWQNTQTLTTIAKGLDGANSSKQFWLSPLKFGLLEKKDPAKPKYPSVPQTMYEIQTNRYPINTFRTFFSGFLAFLMIGRLILWR
jgi:hypothetical protein